MNSTKLKKTIRFNKKNGLYYMLDDQSKIKTFKPWLGDMFSFLYDWIMSKSIFPKKFNGSIQKHFEILKNECQVIHQKKILDIAAGSGNVVKFLNNDNFYTGADISTGLLRLAVKKLKQNKFQDAEFYITDANELPFGDEYFDFSLCNLSLNFFNNIDRFIVELKRVLKPGGTFFCTIPLPEMIKPGVKIQGTLYSEAKLKQLFETYGFSFKSLPYKNGAVLYFTAQLNLSIPDLYTNQ